MTYSQWGNAGNWKKQKAKGAWKGHQEGWTGKGQSPQAETVLGFDGRKVALPAMPSSSHASSSGPSEAETLKVMVKKLANGEKLNEDEMKSLEESPRQVLSNKQKTLNKERRQLNKEKNLEAKLRQNEENYNSWIIAQKERYKALVKNERDRYEAEQERIKKALMEMRNPTQPSDSEEEMLMDTSHTDGGYNQALESRMLQAEKLAYDAQQAFLSLQGQMQTWMAHSMQATPGPPQPMPASSPMAHGTTHLAAPATPLATEKVNKGHANAQLPKGPKPTMERSEVQKSHLKTKSPTTGGPVKPTKEGDKNKTAAEVVHIPDDDPDTALL